MCFSWEAPLVPMCHFWGPYALPDRSGNHGVCMIHFIQRRSTVEMSDFLISLKLKRFSWEAPLVPMCHFWGPYALPDRSGSANVTVSHPLARKDPRKLWGPYALPPVRQCVRTPAKRVRTPEMLRTLSFWVPYILLGSLRIARPVAFFWGPYALTAYVLTFFSTTVLVSHISCCFNLKLLAVEICRVFLPVHLRCQKYFSN